MLLLYLFFITFNHATDDVFGPDMFNLMNLTPENIVFSPLSLEACFSLLYPGTVGKNEQELASSAHEELKQKYQSIQRENELLKQPTSTNIVYFCSFLICLKFYYRF